MGYCIIYPLSAPLSILLSWRCGESNIEAQSEVTGGWRSLTRAMDSVQPPTLTLLHLPPPPSVTKSVITYGDPVNCLSSV